MIKAIATDLDGTLFYPKRRFRLISTANRQFIKNASFSGKEVILVTGRNLFVPSKVNKKVALEKNISVVACNGARVIHNNNVIYEKAIPSEKALKLYERLSKYKEVKTLMIFPNHFHMYVDSSGLSPLFKFFGWLGMNLQGAYFEPFKLGKRKTLSIIGKPDTKVYKVMPWFGLGKKGVQTARRVYDEFVKDFGDEFEIWFSGSAIEIMEKGVNKAESLKKVLDICNIKYDEVAVVGDSGNDIPLFENFEHSFVMNHAPEEVKQKAKVRLKSFDDLADYIK
jgi:Cof subfamily protein (haloacid dehalogenase superfamily)